MELLILRANVKEKAEVTISRFQSGLNIDIRDGVELLPFKDFNDLVQLCVRVKQQIKTRSSSRKDYPSTSYSGKESKREGYPSKFGYERPKNTGKEKEIEK